RAECIRADPLRPNIPRRAAATPGGLFGGVEPLDMADLQKGVVLRGEINQEPGVVQVAGERLLDERGNAAGEEELSHFSMGEGGHGDADCVDQSIELAEVGEPAGLAGSGGLFSELRIYIS